jgi:hypothetical protein
MKRDWILLLVAAGLTWGWVKSYGDKRASDALAEARGDSLRRELATGDSIRGLLQAKALALDSMRQAQAQHYRRDRAVLAVANRRNDSTAAVLDSVLRVLPDTAPLAIAITNERVAGQICRYALASCDSLGVLLTAEVANRDSVIAILEPSLASTRRLWEAAEKRARPGLFGKLRAGLPFLGIGAGIVLLFK